MHKFFERHDNWSQYVASDNYKAKALCMKPVFALREEKFRKLECQKLSPVVHCYSRKRDNALKFKTSQKFEINTFCGDKNSCCYI